MVSSAKLSLNIIICGAGLGGLGAAIGLAKRGHKVIVLESASALNEVGAGIQIPPNSVKVLEAYGIKDKIEQAITLPGAIQIKRYSDGEFLSRTPLHPEMTENYQNPYWLIHRADYQKILYDSALAAGATIKMGSRVELVDQAAVTVTLTNGDIYKADLIIGADGIRSKVRDTAVVNEEVVLPNSSACCAYRATVPAEVMLADPKIAHLMTDINSNCWIGYRRHIMSYPIRNGAMYNIVMIHPGQAAVGKWNEEASIEEMLNHYKDWDPVVKQLLSHVTSVLKWVLADMPVLPRWVSESGHVALLGDAAHAMLPYLAQGAAQAIEDGACIAAVLDDCESREDIPAAMRSYERRRKRRCEKIQAGARVAGDRWHMPNGEEQEERDAMMKEALIKGTNKAASNPGGKSNPNQWSDPSFQSWLFGWDAFTD